MTFPKARPGMRAKVGGELLSAGSAGDRPFQGVLRSGGTPRWICYHSHQSTESARLCAAEELDRRRTLSVDTGKTEGVDSTPVEP